MITTRMRNITPAKIRLKLRYLQRRILKGFDIKCKTKYGFSLWLNLKRDVDYFMYIGEFEKSNLDIFFSLVRMNDIIVDVGANIGIYSILASTKLAATGNVFAFEPSEWARKRLEKNLILNNVHNVSIIAKGVSDKTGKIDFYVCEDDAYSSIGTVPMRPVIRKEVIDVIALDDFCRERGINKIDILKIDAEGADYLVLRGAKGILEREQSPIIFCEYNRNIRSGYEFSIDDLYRYVVSLGYCVYELQGNTLLKFDPHTSKSNEIICVKPNHETFLRKAIHETNSRH